VSERHAAGLVDLRAHIDWEVRASRSTTQTEHV